MTNYEDILDIDIFTKLMKAIQDFSHFESYKILFLRSFHFFYNKKRDIWCINMNLFSELMNINLLQLDF